MRCADSVSIRAIGPVNIMAKKRKVASPLSSGSPSTGVKSIYSQTRDDVQELRQRLTDLQRSLQDLEQENDNMQQRARQACLIFSGSAIHVYSQEEETGKMLKELLFKHMKFDLNLSQVNLSLHFACEVRTFSWNLVRWVRDRTGTPFTDRKLG